MRTLLTLISLTTLSALALPALAQPAPPPPPHDRATITVHGDGRSEAPPDYAAITADVTTAAPSLDVASRTHRARATRAADVLKGLAAKGLEIKSSTFHINNTTPHPVAGKPAPAPEFRAVTSFSLQTRNIKDIDDIVTAIAATGLFEVRGVNFALDVRSKAVDAARRDAVADAKNRASVYAEAAGAELGEVLEISDSERGVPFMRAAAPMAASPQKMQVMPPDALTATASVTITWRLRPKP
jgi:uncharacterized protein YggE